MRWRRRLIAIGCLVVLAAGARARALETVPDEVAGKASTAPRQFTALRASVPHLAELEEGAIREVALHWLADAAGEGLVRAGARRPLDHLSVLWERRATRSVPRRHDSVPTADRLVVVAVDSRGRELGWQLLADPRIVRAEFPGPDGVLRGEILYRAQTWFLLTLPAGEDIRAIEVLEPIRHTVGPALRSLARCELE